MLMKVQPVPNAAHAFFNESIADRAAVRLARGPRRRRVCEPEAAQAMGLGFPAVLRAAAPDPSG